MRYLQRLFDSLKHYDSLSYLFHKKPMLISTAIKYGEDYKNPIKGQYDSSISIAFKYNRLKLFLELFKTYYVLGYGEMAMIPDMFCFGKYKLLKWIDKYFKWRYQIGNDYIKYLQDVYMLYFSGILTDGSLSMDMTNIHMECLKLVCKWGVPVDIQTINNLAFKGCPKKLEYVHNLNPSLSNGNIMYAIGHPKCMKLLHKWYGKKSPTDRIPKWAIGYPESMRLLLKWKYPIDKEIISKCAKGYPKTLKAIIE